MSLSYQKKCRAAPCALDEQLHHAQLHPLHAHGRRRPPLPPHRTCCRREGAYSGRCRSHPAPSEPNQNAYQRKTTLSGRPQVRVQETYWRRLDCEWYQHDEQFWRPLQLPAAPQPSERHRRRPYEPQAKLHQGAAAGRATRSDARCPSGQTPRDGIPASPT